MAQSEAEVASSFTAPARAAGGTTPAGGRAPSVVIDAITSQPGRHRRQGRLRKPSGIVMKVQLASELHAARVYYGLH